MTVLLDDVAAVLASAFADDPHLAHVLPNARRRARALPGYLGAIARYAGRWGRLDTLSRGGRVAAAACWAPPDHPEFLLSRYLAVGGWRAPFLLGFGGFRRAMDLDTELDRMRRRDAPRPHWYLALVGVAPRGQGQGLGGEVLAPALARADRDGAPCYLQTFTPRNVPFYERLGFRVVTEEELAEGLVCRGMARGSI